MIIKASLIVRLPEQIRISLIYVLTCTYNKLSCIGSLWSMFWSEKKNLRLNNNTSLSVTPCSLRVLEWSNQSTENLNKLKIKLFKHKKKKKNTKTNVSSTLFYFGERYLVIPFLYCRRICEHNNLKKYSRVKKGNNNFKN